MAPACKERDSQWQNICHGHRQKSTLEIGISLNAEHFIAELLLKALPLPGAQNLLLFHPARSPQPWAAFPIPGQLFPSFPIPFPALDNLSYPFPSLPQPFPGFPIPFQPFPIPFPILFASHSQSCSPFLQQRTFPRCQIRWQWANPTNCRSKSSGCSWFSVLPVRRHIQSDRSSNPSQGNFSFQLLSLGPTLTNLLFLYPPAWAFRIYEPELPHKAANSKGSSFSCTSENFLVAKKKIPSTTLMRFL